MNIQLSPLREIDRFELIELMNNPLVRRHMPLAKGRFEAKDYEAFIAAKEKMWEVSGYGPWAFVVDGRFSGWGGLQAENGDADLALVLHPDYWGIGKILYHKIVRRAFEEMGLETVTVLLPPTRKKIGALLRLGFRLDGQRDVAGETFIRYRLDKASEKTAFSNVP